MRTRAGLCSSRWQAGSSAEQRTKPPPPLLSAVLTLLDFRLLHSMVRGPTSYYGLPSFQPHTRRKVLWLGIRINLSLRELRGPDGVAIFLAAFAQPYKRNVAHPALLMTPCAW
ncbi:hypothetical protein JDV02_005748 [Purpureocillium takamizusanense]|uniref:Uncharacterized protein n=1 Tax=Purpureocillium takamizusanense TaxID=2060973 RepID=A0A9Q8QJ58_9HYPO|nr:uncharacterized protein JDV02_005748 [Purpureocillium takamizusanense]UNI19567.1 hypothetical protein JDV02_005748 [Purpureocillium takamizusanense]